MEQNPFDSIPVKDANSLFGRIVTRLKGYTPTHNEVESFKRAARTVVYGTVGSVLVGGYAGFKYARFKKWASFQRFITISAGSSIGLWVGSSISTSMAAKSVLELQDSHIAKVLREEALREKGLVVEEVIDLTVKPDEGFHPDVNDNHNDAIEPVAGPGWAKASAAPRQVVSMGDEFEDELWKDLPGSPKPDSASLHRRRYNQFGEVVE
ncbi:hypothetical protein BJ741DRAFT_610388 [Chytriomyces cf. hyalinus JEL632]|nr:hypothetical protein BJ741DRAFT_610388 [Chytriomyces cf. hyalinus JEL632]